MLPLKLNANSLYLIALALVLAVVLFASGFLISRSIRPASPPSVIHRTTVPVRTTIIREQLPARIDTVYVNGDPQAVASYREVITEGKATVDLDVKFNKSTDMFSVKTDISVLSDSIYVEKNIYHKPKFLRPTIAIGTGFSSGGLDYTAIDAGLIIANKYRITAFASTDQTYGVRLGVDF